MSSKNCKMFVGSVAFFVGYLLPMDNDSPAQIPMTSHYRSRSDASMQYFDIQSLLNRYTRPFTLIEVNAVDGYYTFKTAKDYQNAVFVMTQVPDQQSTDDVRATCTAKSLQNIIVLNKQFTIAELEHIGDCEHFDVVLTFYDAARLDDSWQKEIDALCTLGDTILIGLINHRHDERYNVIKAYIVSKGGKSFGAVYDDGTPSAYQHALYQIEANKKLLHRKTWLWKRMAESTYAIDSTFKQKTLTKPVHWPSGRTQTNQWIPGINLLTFKMCNGVYPTKETIKKCVMQHSHEEQSDWMINKMILQGSTIAWIDTDDLSRQRGGILKPTRYSDSLLQAHLHLLDLDEPAKVEHFFWNTLIKVPVTQKLKVKFYSQFLQPHKTVFLIDVVDKELIDICSNMGTKVFCFNRACRDLHAIAEQFINSDVTIVNNSTLRRYLPTISLDSIDELYRAAHFCVINQDVDRSCELLHGLSKPIPYVQFPFDTKKLDVLKQTLDHLARIGYTSFNFSVRDLASLALADNKHTGITKNWASTPQELLDEINKWAVLDYDENLWGSIYARLVSQTT